MKGLAVPCPEKYGREKQISENFLNLDVYKYAIYRQASDMPQTKERKKTMSGREKLNDGGPAYPIYASAGLTKREWFAGMALGALCQGYNDNHVQAPEIAEFAFIIADAMIAVGEDAKPTAEATV